MLGLYGKTTINTDTDKYEGTDFIALGYIRLDWTTNMGKDHVEWSYSKRMYLDHYYLGNISFGIRRGSNYGKFKELVVVVGLNSPDGDTRGNLRSMMLWIEDHFDWFLTKCEETWGQAAE